MTNSRIVLVMFLRRQIYYANKETRKRRRMTQKPSGKKVVESRQTLNIRPMFLAKTTIVSYHYLHKTKLVGEKKMMAKRCEIGRDHIEQ